MRQHLAHDVRQRFARQDRQASPSARLWAPASRADTRSDEYGELERKMREHMASRRRAAAPSCFRCEMTARSEAHAFISKSCAQSLPGTSVMAPSRPFSGRVRSSTRPSARSATNAAPRRNLPSRLGALRGKVSWSPRSRDDTTRSTDTARRPDVWASRSWRRDPSAPARNRRRGAAAAMTSASCLMTGLAAGNYVLDGEQPRHHALDIAVDRHRGRVERDRRHRGRGVVADAGQRAQALRCSFGKIPPWRSTTARAQACRLRARA